MNSHKLDKCSECSMRARNSKKETVGIYRGYKDFDSIPRARVLHPLHFVE